MAKFTDVLAKGTKAVCGKLYNAFKEDTAKLMIFASVTGVVLAGLSNTLGIAINKKTSKEEKQFLLPMEITDSLMNLATFYASSAGAKKFAENLMDKGVISICKTRCNNSCNSFGFSFGKQCSNSNNQKHCWGKNSTSFEKKSRFR